MAFLVTMKPIPELQQLLVEVEKRYGWPVRTSNGFERLAAAIEHAVGDSPGASTLKRLWGYVPSRTTPRLSTLDLLARYAGHTDFKTFCDSLHAEDSSDFVTDRSVLTSADLETGDRVLVGWAPNRLVTLVYKGDDLFEVEEALHTKLLKGDVFEASCLMQGWPLFVPGVLREGEMTPPYIAGKAHGLSRIDKL